LIHDPSSLNDSNAAPLACTRGRARNNERVRMVSLQWAVCFGTLNYCMMVIGCGSAGKGDNTPSAPADVSAVTNNIPDRPSSDENSPSKVNADPRKKVNVVPPTAEQIKLWTPAQFERVQLLAIRESEKSSFTRRLAPTPDGQHFIVAGSHVVLWSVTNEEPEHVFLEPTPADTERNFLSLAVSPDGKWFAVGDSTGMVRIWSLDDRKESSRKSSAQTEFHGSRFHQTHRRSPPFPTTAW
jgi:WD40 repeat protein